jgi:lysophospholipase L1-like esterase
MTRLGLAALALLFVGAAGTALAFQQWRAGKLALLEVPPQIPIATGTPATPPVLLLFGDSRIAQWQPLPDRPYPIRVSGHPGASAIQLAPTFQQALARHRPAVVLLQLGANDAVGAALADPPTREKALADTLAAIDRMAAAATAHGARLILTEVIPPVRTDPLRRLLLGDRVDAYIAQVNAGLPAIAARHGAKLASPTPLLAPQGTMPDSFRKDWLHLTPEAYRALDPLLPQRIDEPL